jgi:hypothetical protein
MVSLRWLVRWSGRWWRGPVGLSGPGCGGVERGAGPAYYRGAGQPAGVVFDFPIGVGGRGDHGQRVGGAIVCDALDLFAGGVSASQHGRRCAPWAPANQGCAEP